MHRKLQQKVAKNLDKLAKVLYLKSVKVSRTLSAVLPSNQTVRPF
jgi:hypothetical protein